jgi:copper chaperone CopZ
MTTATFSVSGLHCQGCAETVKRTLSGLPDVHSVDVDLEIRGNSRVTVDADHDLAREEVQSALDRGGNFTVV